MDLAIIAHIRGGGQYGRWQLLFLKLVVMVTVDTDMLMD